MLFIDDAHSMALAKTANDSRFTCAAKRSAAASGATPPGRRGPAFQPDELGEPVLSKRVLA